MNVIVSRRKQANINQEEGAAEVTAVRYDEECGYLVRRPVCYPTWNREGTFGKFSATGGLHLICIACNALFCVIAYCEPNQLTRGGILCFFENVLSFISRLVNAYFAGESRALGVSTRRS